MRVLIIEDEGIAVRNLIRYLEDAPQEFQVVGVIATVTEAISWLGQHEPDLIFMDIHLEDGSCFEIFDLVTVQAPIIFTTAYDQYALQAFEVNSLDYLLKPIAPERFRKALDKLTKRRMDPFDSEVLGRFLNVMRRQSNYKTRFLVRQGENLISIPVEDIAYFEKGDIVVLVTRRGSRYPVNFALDELQAVLDPDLFMRLNRQYMANIHAIGEVKLFFKGKLRIILKPDPGDEITVSQEKARLVKAWLSR